MKRFWNAVIPLLLALSLGVLPASAQKQKKQKSSATDTSDTAAPAPLPLPDNQKIDEVISEMLGYWQIGDVDQMQKYYSPDVIVISGSWDPPVSGWPAYKTAYQSMRARIQGGQLDRTNTLIKVEGNTAWATYQWEYFVTIDQNQDDIRGHTTLFLEKQADTWVIALDHTSVVSNTPQKAPGPSSAPAFVPPTEPPATSPQH